MIDELIERVERGEGADRELDGAIYDFLSRGLPVRVEHLVSLTRPDPNWLPRYTASLDAVLALIEEKLPGWGHCYATGWDPDGNCGGFASPERTVDLTKAVMGQAKAPARALLAAFLRAHKEQHDGR